MGFATLNVIFLSIFLLAAAVQFNDPDALPWMAVYLAAAGMCLLRSARRLPDWLPPALLGGVLAWAVSLLPDVIGQTSIGEVVESLGMQTRAVEEAREIGGLLLIALWAAVLWLRRRGERAAHSSGTGA